MLYQLAHILRNSFPWLWDVIGKVNSMLFAWRYKQSLHTVPQIIDSCKTTDFKIVQLDKTYLKSLVFFFQEQPIESYEFFRPHGFDYNSLAKLAENKSFLAFLVIKVGTTSLREQIVGYFFLRSFFFGKCYRGYITDFQHQRMGINKLMGICATKVACKFKMPMFGTISPSNAASMMSAKAVNEIKILKILDNGDYYVEYLPINKE